MARDNFHYFEKLIMGQSLGIANMFISAFEIIGLYCVIVSK